jgi:hypothetical protein
MRQRPALTPPVAALLALALALAAAAAVSPSSPLYAQSGNRPTALVSQDPRLDPILRNQPPLTEAEIPIAMGTIPCLGEEKGMEKMSKRYNIGTVRLIYVSLKVMAGLQLLDPINSTQEMVIDTYSKYCVPSQSELELISRHKHELRGRLGNTLNTPFVGLKIGESSEEFQFAECGSFGR